MNSSKNCKKHTFQSGNIEKFPKRYFIKKMHDVLYEFLKKIVYIIILTDKKLFPHFLSTLSKLAVFSRNSFIKVKFLYFL